VPARSSLTSPGTCSRARLLPLIAWEPTEKFNVSVLNDTGDFYRFFDATPHAEFLYSCVQKTIEKDLPSETAFLRNYDAFRGQVEDIVDMPERTIDLLFRFLQQNGENLSRRARENEFRALSDDEAARIERIYRASTYRHLQMAAPDRELHWKAERIQKDRNALLQNRRKFQRFHLPRGAPSFA
jgi:hypothetical protein